MPQFTFTPSQVDSKRIRAGLASHNQETKSKYELARFKSPYHGNIVFYTSGKVVVMGSEQQINDFVLEFRSTVMPEPRSKLPAKQTKPTAKKASVTQPVIPDSGQVNLIGSDEVGNGSYFGNLVVVASVLDSDGLQLAKELGVTDSKSMKDERIREIAPILMNQVKHYAYNLSNERYNAVVPSKYNAVSIKCEMHAFAIARLISDHALTPTRIVVDGFTTKPNWDKYLRNRKYNNPATELIKGAEAQYAAVAVSSVIARYLFLKSLDEASRILMTNIPSGAAESADEAGREVVDRFGARILKKWTKLHFANTKRVAPNLFN